MDPSASAGVTTAQDSPKEEARKSHACTHAYTHAYMYMSKHTLMHMCIYRQLRAQVLPPMGKMSIILFPRLWTGGVPETPIQLCLALTPANTKLVCFPFWTLRLQQLKNKIHKPLTLVHHPHAPEGVIKRDVSFQDSPSQSGACGGACLLNYILERGRRHSLLVLPTSGGAGLWVESSLLVTLCKSPGTPYV